MHIKATVKHIDAHRRFHSQLRLSSGIESPLIARWRDEQT